MYWFKPRPITRWRHQQPVIEAAAAVIGHLKPLPMERCCRLVNTSCSVSFCPVLGIYCPYHANCTKCTVTTHFYLSGFTNVGGQSLVPQHRQYRGCPPVQISFQQKHAFFECPIKNTNLWKNNFGVTQGLPPIFGGLVLKLPSPWLWPHWVLKLFGGWAWPD